MKYLVFVFLALTFSACNKIGGTTVKGKVIDFATGQPMVNMRVYAARTPAFRNTSTADADNTDENGEFEIRVWYHSFSSYSCNVSTSGEFMPDSPERGLDSDIDMDRGRQDVIFTLCYKSYLKWDLSNANCQPTDTFKLWVDNVMDGYPFTNTIILVGCESFQGLQFDAVPYHEWNLHWQVIENGVTTDHYDSFYLNPAEEKTYSISY